jgi:5-methylcytosine-specific restriction endonuclease McrA
MQVDHIIPKRNFTAFTLNNYKIPPFLKHLGVNDTHHFDNLNPSCRYCNKHKDTFDLETFRKEIEIQIDRLNKCSANYRIAKRYGLIQETIKPVIFYFETIKP